jgi:hypothetical protein
MVPATLHLTSEEEFRKVPRKKEANKDARDIHREAAVRYLTGKSLPQAPQTDERRAAINKLLGRD